MMELKLINEQGQAAATVSASDALFARDYNEALVHQIVVAYQNNARAGNRADFCPMFSKKSFAVPARLRHTQK